jgi:hypothetical protein
MWMWYYISKMKYHRIFVLDDRLLDGIKQEMF